MSYSLKMTLTALQTLAVVWFAHAVIDQNLIVAAGIQSVTQLPSNKQTCSLNQGLGHQYILQINELGQ